MVKKFLFILKTFMKIYNLISQKHRAHFVFKLDNCNILICSSWDTLYIHFITIYFRQHNILINTECYNIQPFGRLLKLTSIYENILLQFKISWLTYELPGIKKNHKFIVLSMECIYGSTILTDKCTKLSHNS